MKILQVNKFFDLMTGSGVAVYLHELSARLTAAGDEVHVFATQNPGNPPSADAGYFVPRHDLRSRAGLVADTKTAADFIWNTDAKREMEQLLDDVKPDIVHLHNIYHHLSTSILEPIRKRNIPCVQTLHDYKLACPNYKMFTEGSPCERCKDGNYTHAITHHCLGASFATNALAAAEMGFTKATQAYERTVQTFICPSKFMADKMIEWGEPASKMQVLVNPIATSKVVAELDGDYVLCAGRISAEKGIETLIRAAGSIPELRIKIAGTGPEEGKLRALATELNATNVEFVGFKRTPEMIELRRHARALVVPSVWYENASIAVLEALADGVPVVASAIGGLPEQIIEGKNGALVEPRRPEFLAAALRDIALQPLDARLNMGRAARAQVEEKYRWDTHLDGLKKIYADAKRAR